MEDHRNGYSLEFVKSMTTRDSERVRGWYKNLELATLFQPVFSLPHECAIGVEAVLRARDGDGNQLSSARLFADVTNYSETLLLDRLSMTVHLENFFSARSEGNLVFVNVQPEVFLDIDSKDRFLVDLLAACDATRHRVVLEVSGSAVADAARAKAAVAYYRELGCLIAVDDFGAENSDLDSIWPIQPTFVKIDGSILARSRTDAAVKQMLPRVVSVLHQMGSFVAMEGVENRTEALIALEADVDFASGFYFAAPSEEVSSFIDSESRLRSLWGAYKEKEKTAERLPVTERVPLLEDIMRSSLVDRLRTVSAPEIRKYREERRPFLIALQQVVAQIEDGVSFKQACAGFLELAGAIRCFMLDAEGRQVNSDVYAPNPPEARRAEFVMTLESRHSDWSRKDFYRRALKEPGVAQVTRPYRSFNGYGCCVTVSLTAHVDGALRVICGDIDWSSHAQVLPHSLEQPQMLGSPAMC